MSQQATPSVVAPAVPAAMGYLASATSAVPWSPLVHYMEGIANAHPQAAMAALGAKDFRDASFSGAQSRITESPVLFPPSGAPGSGVVVLDVADAAPLAARFAAPRMAALMQDRLRLRNTCYVDTHATFAGTTDTAAYIAGLQACQGQGQT